MILSRRQSFYLIEHLEKAVKALTERNAELSAQVYRQTSYHNLEVEAQSRRIRELEGQIRDRDVTIQKVYRECFL